MNELVDIEKLVSSAQQVRTEMTMKTILITPVIAAQMLQNNVSNRRLSPGNVKYIEGQLRKNNWKLTPESIIFSESRRLLDGQNRLNAIIKSGVSAECTVIINAPDDIFDVLNTGKNRSAADTLHVAGFKNETIKSSIISTVLNYKKGLIRSHLSESGSRKDKISNADILAFNEENEAVLHPISNKAFAYYKDFGAVKPSFVGGMLYILTHIHRAPESKVYEFFDVLTLGNNAPSDHPAMRLRKMLIDDLASTKKLQSSSKLAYFIEAWNAFYSGSKLPKRAWKWREGAEFPKIEPRV